TVDEVCGDASAGEAAVVNAVVVVEGEVGVELASEAAVARVEVAGEGRSPAFVEDRLVQRLDVAVGLWAPGVDAGVADGAALEQLAERGAAELVAVVGEDAFQAPARRLQRIGDAAREAAGLQRGRVALLADHQLGPRE